MKGTPEEAAVWLERQIAGDTPYADILDYDPTLTLDDAYHVQFALMRRLSPRHGGIIGYKAAYTSEVQQKAYEMSGPVVGTLLRSGLVDTEQLQKLVPGRKTVVEPEVAVMLKHPLRGPDLTVATVLHAIAGYAPAIEIAVSPGATRSKQMGIAVHKVTGGIVLGHPMTAPSGIDLRLEGVIASVNGRHIGSGTGIEVLGNPLNAVAHIANTLGRFGLELSAHAIIMTGSIIAGFPVASNDQVSVAFARLGRLDIRFT